MTFDSGKESAHVLCKDDPAGENFRVLGVLFDGKLTMAAAVNETVKGSNLEAEGAGTECKVV